MDESYFRSYKRWQVPVSRRHSRSNGQQVLKAEKKILQSISAQAPLREVLNEICSALDCQIGDTVSLISISGRDATTAAAITQNTGLFGLHAFSSAGIIDESGEDLGFLEMYCCDPRIPSSGEFQLMERALNLAILAIERDRKGSHPANSRVPENRRASRRVLEWPVSANQS
jgi:DNA-binding Xre family transcriptional regulator